MVSRKLPRLTVTGVHGQCEFPLLRRRPGVSVGVTKGLETGEYEAGSGDGVRLVDDPSLGPRG